MSTTFDTLMTANGGDRFRLRPPRNPSAFRPTSSTTASGCVRGALLRRFKVTAADVAFSLNVLKEKGHPNYARS
jgi:hypothetical protein